MRILKIESLNNSKHWIDRDFIILHANFQILKDFVEKEKPFEHSIVWAKSKNGKKCKELYNWWEVRKNQTINNLSKQQMKEDYIKLVDLMKIRNELWT